MFPDVKPKDWFSGAVEYCVKNGIMSGYPDGTFRPENNITRAEVASIVSRLHLATYEQGRIQNVDRNCKPATVTIYPLVNKDGKWVMAGSLGSGTIIDGAGVILTNAHVVGTSNKCLINTSQGDFYGEVEKVGMFTGKNNIPMPGVGNVIVDLATVRITGKANEQAKFGNGFPTVKFAKESPPDGSFVVVIGSPLGIIGWDSLGIVSRKTGHYIDTDCAINPGNSGGGAFNLDGELIGVPVQKYVDVAVDTMGNIIRIEVVKAWLEGRYNEIPY